MPHTAPRPLAAVDLGSNSFRLQIAQESGGQIYPLDSLRESVRLAAGLDAEKKLTQAAQTRALEALARFAQRISALPADAVRAVGTNTLRVARNAADFVQQAQKVLGFPIEIINGQEEARLIYQGVTHSIAQPQQRNLVVDIGGGSTECIIGEGFKPLLLESLHMGCVAYSLKFFADGRMDKKRLRTAELAAQREMEIIATEFNAAGWQRALGSSGSVRAVLEILSANGFGNQVISRAGLDWLREQVLRSEQIHKLRLPGLSPERALILPGGLAILLAVFKAFDLSAMEFAEGALRLGLLYDLLGRERHEDEREASVAQFMQRYQVDRAQARRVEATALHLLAQLRGTPLNAAEAADAQFLSWAARLHLIGISIAHASYHKHGAYILSHAYMPGFSQPEQERLARLVLAHRGNLKRVELTGAQTGAGEWELIGCLRLSVLLHLARNDAPLPRLRVRNIGQGFALEIAAEDLERFPLTLAALREEEAQWQGAGLTLRLQ